MQRTVAIHNLRSNAGERSPKRLLIIDTEASSLLENGREIQRLRLWAANLIVRPKLGPGVLSCEHSWGYSREELADLVSASAVRSPTTWVYTHNLSYDLTTTWLPLELSQRGWQLGQHNLASEAPWALFKRGDRSLRLADSWSWLPVSVKTLGLALQLSKPELPSDDDSDEAWLARCQADLEITTAALVRLMEEWDRLALGWWSLTGPATAWNAMLHMAPTRYGGRRKRGHDPDPLPSRRPHVPVPVIDPDPAARAFERSALYSGRRDLWRVGKLPPGPYNYLDMRSAHLAVCAFKTLPDRRGRHFDSLDVEDRLVGSKVVGMIAECLVRPTVPRYPLRLRGAVVHPLGTFKTTLCGPEIAEAKRRGELLAVGPGWTYRLGIHMHYWAQWAMGLLNQQPAQADPMLLVFLKGASRTVPGRWGMTISRAGHSGDSPHTGWNLERASFGKPSRSGVIFHFGGRWTELVRDQEADDSFPAVLAYIQSWVRLLLGRLIDRVGPWDVLQCNTDSVLVTEQRLWELGWGNWAGPAPALEQTEVFDAALSDLSSHTAPLVTRIKAVADRVELVSPQHLRFDGQRLYSGVPASAEEPEPNQFRFWTWPKLLTQIEKGDPRGYVRELRTVNLSAVPVNRWAYVDGCCEPVEAAWTAAEGNQLCRPRPSGCDLHGAPLRALQHPLLRPLLTG